MRQERQKLLLRESSLLSESPSLKAMMTTSDSRTIAEAGAGFWKLSGNDFFSLQSPGGRLEAYYNSIGGIQKPVVAMPSCTGFPAARLEPAGQARIPLATIKPDLLHLVCLDPNFHDPLALDVLVRERMRDISHPSMRGLQSDPPIIHHDDMFDGPADSLTPKIVYSMGPDGRTVNLELRIDQGDTTLRKAMLALDGVDRTALAGTVAKRLVELATQVPVKSPNL